MGTIRMQVDDGDCIEFWHEHPERPLGSMPAHDADGRLTHWVRFVDMVDRIACPLGDAEILGDPQLLARSVDFERVS